MADQDSVMSILCLGCGEDIRSCKDDRRALGSAAGKRVVESWRAVLGNMDLELEDEKEYSQSLLVFDVKEEKMCMKCFSGFERYSTLLCTLQGNLTRSVKCQVHQEAQEPARKRTRVGEHLIYSGLPSHPENYGESSRSSPSVSVRRLVQFMEKLASL